MKTLECDRGRAVKAPLAWVDFVVAHPDVLAALSKSPLRAEKTDEKHYLLSIFGVRVKLEEVHHQFTEKEGTLKWFADVRLPWGLGTTHTMATYHYFCIDQNTTSLELAISIELTSLLMRIYACGAQERLDRYLNRVCKHVEEAAQVLAAAKEATVARLNEQQMECIEALRAKLSRTRASQPGLGPRLEGALRVLMSDNWVFVAAEARMPDEAILTASGKFGLGADELESLRSGMASLAGINNRALATRGSREAHAPSADFRQTALEYGYKFFQQVCAGQLSSLASVITSHGRHAVLRVSVEGEAEQLPWEVMHDGQEFICIKTCMTRCLTQLRAGSATNEEWDRAGILVVGADAKGDLPGVEQEVEGIGHVLSASGIARFEVLVGKQASRRGVMKAMESGEFGILHFSGHSFFDAAFPNQSHLDMCGGTKIFLHELGHFSHGVNQAAPLRLVFLNSCQSARVGQDSLTGRQLSMCKALREAGVGHVIGMLWNVEDEAAVQVGASFYNNLLNASGKGPEAAMRETRLAVAIERAWADGSWLAPVLYS